MAASGAVEVLDAFGCDLIFVETVGTGQAEVDIVRLADTVAVVTVPHLGDGVQAIKAGVMEIGDLFVVNKADQGDADRAATEIKMMLGLAGDRQGWRPPVLLVSAVDGTGVSASSRNSRGTARIKRPTPSSINAGTRVGARRSFRSPRHG